MNKYKRYIESLRSLLTQVKPKETRGGTDSETYQKSQIEDMSGNFGK